MRPVTPRLRVILELFAGLAFIAGGLLFLGATRTDAWWSWTISPPLTAATLGAFYWAAFIFLDLSAGALGMALEPMDPSAQDEENPELFEGREGS